MYKLYNYDTNKIRINTNDTDIRFYNKSELTVFAQNNQIIINERSIPFKDIEVPSFDTLEEYVIEIQSWVDVDSTHAGTEYDVSATASSDGHVVHSEYIATSKNSLADQSGILGRNVLWNRLNGETGIFTIAAIRTSSTNASVLVSLKWSEIR